MVCYGSFGRLSMDKYKLHHSVLPRLTSRIVEVLAAIAVVLVVILVLQ